MKHDAPTAIKRRIPVNGWIAWREGADLSDNPFDADRQPTQHEQWRAEFLNAEAYIVFGKETR